MKALTFRLDRQGTLYADGKIHSTGLFDLHSGLYVESLECAADAPTGDAIVLLADDGERFEIGRISTCPSGEAHYHFVVE